MDFSELLPLFHSSPRYIQALHSYFGEHPKAEFNGEVAQDLSSTPSPPGREFGPFNGSHNSNGNDNYLHQNSHHHHHILTAIPGLFGLGEESKDEYGNSEDELVTKIASPLPSDYEIYELPLRLPIWGVVILVLVYIPVFLCGVVGNLSVLFVVVRLRKMKTLVNLFIFNLAISDLLVLFFCFLPNLLSNIFVPWILGWFLCKTVPYIQGVSVCASIYSLLAISVERCISIQWPFKYLVTKGRAKVIIGIIWIWSGIVALPWALFFQTGNFDEDNPNLEFCVEQWPEEYPNGSTYFFLIGNLLIMYVLPLAVILISYVTIWYRVYRRQIPSDSYHKAVKLIHQKSKTAVLKMITVVVLIFALSWLPLYAIMCRVKFAEDMSELESSLISIIYPFAQWLISFNSCMNAIIYSFINKKFRNAFKKILGQCCGGAGPWAQKKAPIKHKSPTVNILLKRFSTYRVETTMSSNEDAEDSSESI